MNTRGLAVDNPNRMDRIPIVLVRALIEAALNQPNPSSSLQVTLNHALKAGGHKDRLR